MQNTYATTHHGLLLENTLARVTLTLQPQQERKYDLEQEYFGIVGGELEVIGRTLFADNTTR